MEPEVLRAALNAGGFALLAVVMTILHLYNVRVAIPQMQRDFHSELERERSTWVVEMRTQRERDDERQQALLQLVYEGKACRYNGPGPQGR